VSDITVTVAANAPSVAVTEQAVFASTPAPQPVAVSVAGASPAPVSVSQSSVFQAVVSPAVPPSGGEPTPAPETYETVSRNLKSYPATLSYAAGELSSISYATPGGAVVKTFNRVAGRLASIVLSGALPSGIATTKTLTYSGDTLTGVAYG
jgi:hypothetical protein